MSESSQSWRKFFSWLAQVASGLVVVTSIIAATIYVIKAETSDLRSDVASLKNQVKDMGEDVKRTNDRIDGVLSQALSRILPATDSKTRPSAKSLERAQEIVAMARSTNAKLDPEVLARYGSQVVAWSADPALSPVAWRNVTQVLGYRSFLNADFVPKLTDLTPWPENDKYQSSVNIRPDESAPRPARSLTVYHAGGYQTESHSARLEILHRPQPQGSGIGFFVIEGGADFVVLDGMYMKNVVVRNARVIYEGGPVKLENVYFVNCSFNLPKSLPTRNFSNAVLRTSSIEFSNNSPS